MLYDELERWYKGGPVLEIVIDKTTERPISRYPLQLNPLTNTVAKHAALLVGALPNSASAGGIPVSFQPDVLKDDLKSARDVAKVLRDTWADSSGGALFQQNALLSQYMGGCVFAAKWRPDLNRIQITAPNPRDIVAIPEGTDYFDMREGWIARQISSIEAYSYGVKLATNDPHKIYWYVEHWTRDNYEISINQETLVMGGQEMKGVNPFGVVPIVYIPHIRDVGFLGQSIITEATKELSRNTTCALPILAMLLAKIVII